MPHDTLNDLSEALAAAVAAVAASVVRVKPHRRHVSSGVVLAPDRVITTHHDLGGQVEQVPLLLGEGQEVLARVIGRDPATDLALLGVEDGGLSVPTWHDAAALRPGHVVLALGRPNSGIRALFGIVGGVEGPWETALGGRVDRYVDVDATLRWGFAGGPLIDARGRVVGVNSAALTRGGTTVPTETVRRVAEALASNGSTRGAYLGLSATPVTLPSAIAERVGQGQGALVVNVSAGGPAEAAGLHLGDTLLAIAARPTRTVGDVAVALAGLQPGTAADLLVLRAGEILTLSATLGER